MAEKKEKLPLVDNPYEAFNKFVKRLELLHSKHQTLLQNTLANIFSMRFIGNKTHGDLAEIAITEFIKQYMYDYTCEHVGKEYYRSKEHEEDIAIALIDDAVNPQKYIPVSLKAYGIGPLQLSTDKESTLFNGIEGKSISDTEDANTINEVMQLDGFKNLTNVLPLIYEEKKYKKRKNLFRCNILIFDIPKMKQHTKRIVRVGPGEYFDYTKGKLCKAKKNKERKHPVFLFLAKSEEPVKYSYICEVRYGDAKANALQRGLWTNTKEAESYFHKFFNNWLEYEKQEDLIQLIGHSLITTTEAHKAADKTLISFIKKQSPGEYDK